MMFSIETKCYPSVGIYTNGEPAALFFLFMPNVC